MPGDLVGTFAVTGVMNESDCGPGAFGAPDPWKFEIKLSREDSSLYWYNGQEAVAGSVSADGSFLFKSGVQATMAEPVKGRGGCVLARTDELSGKLAGTGTDISGFTGTMRYTFKPEAGSECVEILASEGVLALPCSMTYTLKAARAQ